MNASFPDREREKAALRRLRFAVDSMAGDNWIVDVDGDRVNLIAGRATGEDAHLCTIHAAALATERDLICGALGNLVMLLAIIDRAAVAVRALQTQIDRLEAEKREKNYAAQASMLLANRQFQLFLETKGAGGPVRDKGAADTRLKFVLGVESKKQLNTDERARAGWKRLVGEFETFKKGGGW